MKCSAPMCGDFCGIGDIKKFICNEMTGNHDIKIILDNFKFISLLVYDGDILLGYIDAKRNIHRFFHRWAHSFTNDPSLDILMKHCNSPEFITAHSDYNIIVEDIG